jgi:hypothetical protein
MRGTLVDLSNTINACSGPLAIFYEDANWQAGHELVSTLEQVRDDVDALIPGVTSDLEDVEAAEDAAVAVPPSEPE